MTIALEKVLFKSTVHPLSDITLKSATFTYKFAVLTKMQIWQLKRELMKCYFHYFALFLFQVKQKTDDLLTNLQTAQNNFNNDADNLVKRVSTFVMLLEFLSLYILYTLNLYFIQRLFTLSCFYYDNEEG